MAAVPEEEEDLEGEELAPRDAMVVNGGVTEMDYPIGLLRCRVDGDGDSECWCEIAVVTELNDRLVVCVPGAVWHRRAQGRVLGRSALSKATAVDVGACLAEAREELVPNALRAWIGLLHPTFEGGVAFSSTSQADYAFGVDSHGQALLPHAGSLAAAAAELFQFETAESGGPDAQGELGVGFKRWRRRWPASAPA